MIFTSIHYLFFFPLVVAGFYLLPHRWRWIWLLGMSSYFYMVFIPRYILILLFLILVDYTAGLLIEGSQGKRRTLFLILSCIANLGVLGCFKYFNFVSANMTSLARGLGWPGSLPLLRLVLPIGLSFHTFQSLGYTIDVYWGVRPAERHLGIYALYVMFFPQLVAGPIERSTHLLPQFHQEQTFKYPQAVQGIQLIAWGFFQKMVIADRLAPYVDYAYSHSRECGGLTLLIASVLFTVQIYCDFAGYSNIAIGSAQVLGVELTQNFNLPLFATSTPDFWRRWHISLSTWFRDYVYYPLALRGSRSAMRNPSVYILIVFLLMGFWHGANWNFGIFGLLNGLYVVIANQWKSSRFSFELGRAGSTLLTFSATCFAFIFFRAASLRQALQIVRAIGQSFFHLSGARLHEALASFQRSRSDMLFCGLSVALLLGVELLQERVVLRNWITERPVWLRWGLYYAGVFSFLFLCRLEVRDFIYFQF